MAVTAAKAGDEAPVGRVESGPAARDKFAAVAIEALARRGDGKFDGPPSAGAKEMEYASLVDIAKESFRVAGAGRVTGMPEDIAQAALGDVEMARNLGADVPVHGPGSFPNILSGLANKVLEDTPPYQGTTFQNWAAKRPSVPDFKPTTLLRYGEFGLLPEEGTNVEIDHVSTSRFLLFGFIGKESCVTFLDSLSNRFPAGINSFPNNDHGTVFFFNSATF